MSEGHVIRLTENVEAEWAMAGASEAARPPLC